MRKQKIQFIVLAVILIVCIVDILELYPFTKIKSQMKKKLQL